MESSKHMGIVLIIAVLLCGVFYLKLTNWVIELVDYIFKYYQLFFIPRITIIDILVIGFIPFWSYLCYRPFPSILKIILLNLIFVLSIVSFVFIGGMIARNFDNRVSPLLPEYIIGEVFPYYWTLIVLLGVLFPMILYRPWLNESIIITEEIVE